MDDIMDSKNLEPEKQILPYRRQKLEAFFKEEKFTDCTFKFGKIEVKAHKFILACSSPVFETMLFGDMAQSEVEVMDMNVEDFKQVLEYIYLGAINITSQENAWKVYSIANKYLIEDLTEDCLNYIERNLSIGNLALTYECAEFYNINELREKCLNDMTNYVLGVLECDYHMKSSTLKNILERISHLYYFNPIPKIFQWALDECDFLKDEITPEMIVEMLEEHGILESIKYTWLLRRCHKCDFAICDCMGKSMHPVYCKFVDLLKKAIDPHQEKRHFVEKTTNSMFSLACFYSNASKFRKQFKVAQRTKLQKNEEFISAISANARLMIFGIFVSYGALPDNLHSTVCKGSIAVRICKHGSSESVVPPTTIDGEFHYDCSVYVPLKHVFTLESNTLYYIRISYNTCGSNVNGMDVLCYFMSNELVDCSKNIAITFHDYYGSVIQGLSFYAA